MGLHVNRCLGYSQQDIILFRILTRRRQPDTATGTRFRQKTFLFKVLTRRRQPDTAAPSFEVANAPYMQYKGQTQKKQTFSKSCFPGPKSLVEHVRLCRTPYNTHISHMDPKSKNPTKYHKITDFHMMPFKVPEAPPK